MYILTESKEFSNVAVYFPVMGVKADEGELSAVRDLQGLSVYIHDRPLSFDIGKSG